MGYKKNKTEVYKLEIKHEPIVKKYWDSKPLFNQAVIDLTWKELIALLPK